MMTKQHFEAIAQIIKDNREHEGDIHTLDRLGWLTQDLAEYFARENERFVYAKFLTACGIA